MINKKYLSKLNTDTLIQWLQELHETIYSEGCYGVDDLKFYDLLESILIKRGVNLDEEIIK